MSQPPPVLEAEAVGLDDLDHARPALQGGPVFDRLWRRLDLNGVLAELVAERAYGSDVERLLFAMVASPALAPRSKLALERWVERKVAIPGLEAVAVHNLYRAMDSWSRKVEPLTSRGAQSSGDREQPRQGLPG